MAADSVAVKICGLTDGEGVDAAVEAGADYLGVVLHADSPRAIGAACAAELLSGIPARLRRVGLFVEADDRAFDAALKHIRLDMLQLHGRETPERVKQIRLAYGIPVMKAVGISAAADFEQAKTYLDVADQLMFDAKPPPGAKRPGGHGIAFDWTLLAGRAWPLPWMLAGGLTLENVAEAIARSGAKMVDVSSGVERAPGIKDPDKVRQFIAAAKGRSHVI